MAVTKKQRWKKERRVFGFAISNESGYRERLSRCPSGTKSLSRHEEEGGTTVLKVAGDSSTVPRGDYGGATSLGGRAGAAV